MLIKEIIAVYSENHANHKYKTALRIAKVAETYIYH
jgi:hypothetical protein